MCFGKYEVLKKRLSRVGADAEADAGVSNSSFLDFVLVS